MGYTMELAKFFFIIVLLAVGCYFLAKKLKKSKWSKESAQGIIEMQDVIRIGMNQSVTLMKVGDEYVLLANSGQQISMLKLDSKEIKNAKVEFDEVFASQTPTTALKEIKSRLGEKFK